MLQVVAAIMIRRNVRDFDVQLMRWLVEYTCMWFNRSRQCSKPYDVRPKTIQL